MIKVTVEEITEIEETVLLYEDPETGKQYCSKYSIPENQRELVWGRIKNSMRVKTGKKEWQKKTVYEQTISNDADNDRVLVENIIKAANRI